MTNLSLLQEQEGGQTNAPPPPRPTEEWMLICQRNADLQPSMATQDGIDWTLAAHSYPTLEEAPSFISQQRQAAGQHVFTTSADPANLQGKQQQVYTIVQPHSHQSTGPLSLLHCPQLLKLWSSTTCPGQWSAHHRHQGCPHWSQCCQGPS